MIEGPKGAKFLARRKAKEYKPERPFEEYGPMDDESAMDDVEGESEDEYKGEYSRDEEVEEAL